MAIKKPVYQVTITEQLVKTVYVEAWTPAAARECVEHLYCELGDIVLTADDYNVETSDLSKSSQEYVVSGKEKYSELDIYNIGLNEKRKGYVGFLVPRNSKILKFYIDGKEVLSIDNPAYEE